MNKRKTLCLLILLPLLVSCKNKELIIPNVDVLNKTINLPTKPVYNEGAIRVENGHDVLDIYELSDFHGAVNFDQDGKNLGLSRLASYLNKKRNENPGGTIVVSSGDMFQGSCESNLTRGYLVNYSMNYMGFDAMAVGNHEFDWGEEWLKRNAELKYNNWSTPMLASNVVYKTTSERPSYLKGSTTIERGQYKIGIVGSIGSGLTKSILASSIEPFKFTDEATAVNSEVANLKLDGCDAVIWNSHNSGKYLGPISQNVNDVDVCFGGHAHTNFVSRPANGIKIVATQNNGSSIAHATIELNQITKAVEKTTVEYLEFNQLGVSSLEEDQGVNSIMSQYNSDIDEVKNIKLGRAKGELKRDEELVNMSTKSMFEAAKDFVSKNPSYGIDPNDIIAAYHNGNGGVRAKISKGKIYYRDIYQSFPFDNEIVLAKVTPSKLSLALRGYNIYHEVKSVYDLDSTKEYYVVLNDFIATGDKLRYEEDELVRTGIILRDELASFVYKQGKIKPEKFSNSSIQFNQF